MNRARPADHPSCFSCHHFFITYQPPHPYGCRAMAFKSQQLPARIVQESSRIPCQLYQPAADQKSEKSLTDQLK